MRRHASIGPVGSSPPRARSPPTAHPEVDLAPSGCTKVPAFGASDAGGSHLERRAGAVAAGRSGRSACAAATRAGAAAPRLYARPRSSGGAPVGAGVSRTRAGGPARGRGTLPRRSRPPTVGGYRVRPGIARSALITGLTPFAGATVRSRRRGRRAPAGGLASRRRGRRPGPRPRSTRGAGPGGNGAAAPWGGRGRGERPLPRGGTIQPERRRGSGRGGHVGQRGRVQAGPRRQRARQHERRRRRRGVTRGVPVPQHGHPVREQSDQHDREGGGQRHQNGARRSDRDPPRPGDRRRRAPWSPAPCRSHQIGHALRVRGQVGKLEGGDEDPGREGSIVLPGLELVSVDRPAGPGGEVGGEPLQVLAANPTRIAEDERGLLAKRSGPRGIVSVPPTRMDDVTPRHRNRQFPSSPLKVGSSKRAAPVNSARPRSQVVPGPALPPPDDQPRPDPAAGQAPSGGSGRAPQTGSRPSPGPSHRRQGDERERCASSAASSPPPQRHAAPPRSWTSPRSSPKRASR